jgi:steroid delta-isomerase-like uncharacterized protein
MDHAATMRRVYDLINAGDIDGFGELLADGMVEHEDLPGFARDREGVMAFFRMMVAAFPDMRMTPDDVLVDGDKAVARVTATGTHKGEFMGMPPTGRTFDVQVIDIMRWDGDGRVAEHWGVFDAMLMMQQLGAIPEPQPTA